MRAGKKQAFFQRTDIDDDDDDIELTEDDKNKYKHWDMLKNNMPKKLENKYLLFSSVSNKFEKLNNNDKYTFYHLVLDHDDDINKSYGIWANNILIETICEKHFYDDSSKMTLVR